MTEIRKVKCPKCGSWNENRDYCYSCNTLINYQLEREMKESQRKLEKQNAPKDKWDIWMENMKNSDKIFHKMIYWGLQSTWFLLLAFVTIAISVLIFGPG